MRLLSLKPQLLSSPWRTLEWLHQSTCTLCPNPQQQQQCLGLLLFPSETPRLYSLHGILRAQRPTTTFIPLRPVVTRMLRHKPEIENGHVNVRVPILAECFRCVSNRPPIAKSIDGAQRVMCRIGTLSLIYKRFDTMTQWTPTPRSRFSNNPHTMSLHYASKVSTHRNVSLFEAGDR